jgi:hypothetical protein
LRVVALDLAGIAASDLRIDLSAAICSAMAGKFS